MNRETFEQKRLSDHDEAHKINDELASLEKRAAEIKGKPETAVSAPKERTAAEKEIIASWENLYKKLFPEKTIDLSKVEIPKRTPEEEKEFTRLIVRAEGINEEDLFQKCAELFPADKYTDKKLNEIANNFVKRPEGSYAVWARDVQEADEKHKNKSANMAEKEKLDVETLGDRLAHELKYFDETGKHLDIDNVTLTGSRNPDGYVLNVYWNDGKMHVGWRHSDGRVGSRRFRQVVSSAAGGK